MGSICIILKRPPYGTVDAAEAIRHALGGITDDMDVRLVIMADGIQAARKGQDISSTEYLSIEDGMKDCIDMGVEVFVERDAMTKAGITAADMIEGLSISTGTEIAEKVRQSDTLMIF